MIALVVHLATVRTKLFNCVIIGARATPSCLKELRRSVPGSKEQRQAEVDSMSIGNAPYNTTTGNTVMPGNVTSQVHYKYF